MTKWDTCIIVGLLIIGSILVWGTAFVWAGIALKIGALAYLAIRFIWVSGALGVELIRARGRSVS